MQQSHTYPLSVNGVGKNSKCGANQEKMDPSRITIECHLFLENIPMTPFPLFDLKEYCADNKRLVNGTNTSIVNGVAHSGAKKVNLLSFIQSTKE